MDNKPVEVGEVVEGKIEDINSQGKGVLRVDNFAIFTDKGIIGETVEVKIEKLQRNYGIGKTLSIKEESDNRIESKCPVHEKCGGCQLHEVKYESQLEFKESKVKDALERIGGLEDVVIEDIIGMDDPYRYRNNVQIPLGKFRNKAIIGNYEKGSNRIVDREECIISPIAADQVVKAVREYINEFDIPTYSRRKNAGILRHVIVRHSKHDNGVLVGLVTKDRLLPKQDELIKILEKHVDNLKGVFQNINDKRTNMVLGKKSFAIHGDEIIVDELNGLKFEISPGSFFQVNTDQAEVLYDKVTEFADLTGDEVVLDLYSGIGTISLNMAKKAKSVYGIESVEESVIDADMNAELNELENAHFIHGLVEEVFPAILGDEIDPDIIVIDPPRKGCDEAVLNMMAESDIEKIIYVSCNPATLARDLEVLVEGGYKVKKVQPIDMFPWTIHVESVALIEK